MLRPGARSSHHAGQVSNQCGRLRGLRVLRADDPASHDERLWARQAAGAWFAAKAVECLGGSVPLFSGIYAARDRPYYTRQKGLTYSLDDGSRTKETRIVTTLNIM